MNPQTLEFQSDLLRRTVRLHVIMPDGADALLDGQDSDRRYPVVYLHHGLGDDHTAFCRRTDIVQLAADRELIFVMPDAGSSWFCDDPRDAGLPWDEHLSCELVDWIDRRLPTIADRTARGLAGFSMGGYGAMLYGLKYPDRFGAVYGISGSYLFGHELRPDRPERAEFMMAVAPPDGPYDLFRLSSELMSDGKSPCPTIRFSVGRNDHLLESNQRLHSHFESIGLPHVYEEFEGQHRWQFVQQRLPMVVDWLSERLCR